VHPKLTIAHGLLNNAGDASVQGPGGKDTIGLAGAGRGAPPNFGSGSGGGIQSIGPMTLDHVVVRDNGDRNAPFADQGDPGRPTGGGIAASGGPAHIVDTQVIGNSVAHTPSGDGGGAAIEGVADLTITDSTVSRNMINGSDESIVGNGGGLDLDGSSGVISGSTIDGTDTFIKDGAGAGGLTGTSLIVVNSTIGDNPSPGSDIEVAGQWVVVDSTIVGLAVVFGSGSLVMSGSILSGCLVGAVTSNGWNIVGDTSCGTLTPSDLVSTDPLLGPPARNGGRTWTRAPGPGSPAIDRIPSGTPGLCDGTMATDQRGVARPRGAGCDVGAVEQ
jgi:hypothetical protein